MNGTVVLVADASSGIGGASAQALVEVAAAFTAAPIANADPMSTSLQAAKIAAVRFVFPFVFRPSLLIQGGPLVEIPNVSLSGLIVAFA